MKKIINKKRGKNPALHHAKPAVLEAAGFNELQKLRHVCTSVKKGKIKTSDAV